MGFIEGLLDDIELTHSERQAMDEAQEQDGEPTQADLLIMQYYVATEGEAGADARLQHLHAITKAYFNRRFSNVMRVAERIADSRSGLNSAANDGA